MIDDVSIYINFVLYVILGRLREADVLMRKKGEMIRLVAEYCMTKRPIAPIAPKPLYRGVLLDPAQPFTLDPKYTFLSWSEDRDVATWFACTRNHISDLVMDVYPHFQGYIITLPQPQSRVLFHHSWAHTFTKVIAEAHRHPLIGEEGKRQIIWSLKTQSEVITDPAEGLEPRLAPDLDDATVAALETRLLPPWINR